MSGQEPRLRIRGKLYAYPSTSKLGDAALIEQLTGLKHSEWRQRYIDSIARVIDAGEDEEVMEDSAITIGIVGMAVQRANPKWPRVEVVEFVNNLDFEEIEVEGGDGGPLLEAETSPDITPSSESRSPSGQEPARTSSSESESDSRKSTTPQTSGALTSPTSQED